MPKRVGNYPTGKNHPAWKGDGVSYSALHTWIRRYFFKRGFCEHCLAERDTDWALREGRPPSRDRSDWLELCRSCHTTYDWTPERSAVQSRALRGMVHNTEWITKRSAANRARNLPRNQAIVAEIRNGSSVQKLAKEYGLSIRTVRRIVARSS